MQIELTITPHYALVGFDWYLADEEFDFHEVNIFLLFIKISFQWRT